MGELHATVTMLIYNISLLKLPCSTMVGDGWAGNLEPVEVAAK